MKKSFALLIILFYFLSCNKIQEMKNKLIPERPYEKADIDTVIVGGGGAYEKANIDKFYWATSGSDYTTIPLIKPYNLQKLQGQNEWILETHIKNPRIEKFHGRDTVLMSFSPLELFNVHDIYIWL